MKVPDKVLNKDLWKKARKEADKKYDKPSAYKSGYIVQRYKELGGKFKGEKTKKGLTRWFKEEWVNQRGEVGYKKKGDIYRPSKRVSKKTPVTWSELSDKEIEWAIEEKKKKKRITRFKK
jgi:hypothetical protein